MFKFPLTGISSNSFTNITKALASPDWTNARPFQREYVTSMDIYGEYTASERALRLEIDSLTAVGPVLVFGPAIELLRAGQNVTLRWPTNDAEGFRLESATNVIGPWSSEATVSITGSLFQTNFASTNGNRFFRLVKLGSGFSASPGRKHLISFDVTGRNFNIPLPLRPQPQFETTEKDVAPPPPVTNYANFIDVSSYLGWSSNAFFNEQGGLEPTDYQVAYALSFDDHNGGTTHYEMFDCDRHGGTSGSPWTRLSNHWFSYIETYSPGSTNWPNGLRTETGYTRWMGNAGPTQSVGRPYIPWARIDLGAQVGAGDTNVGGPGSGWRASTFRSDETHLHLHTGLLETNQISKWALVSVTANSVALMSSEWGMAAYLLEGDEGCGCYWPESGSLGTISAPATIPFSNITCLANVPNADNRIFLPLISSSTYDATPSVSPSTNFTFSVSILPHHVVNMTRHYHPLFDQPPANTPSLTVLRLRYRSGSIILCRDDDAKIPDGDASVVFSNDKTSLYRNDDAPAYLEFRIGDGPLTTNVYTRDLKPVFPWPWNNQRYYNIVTESDAQSLLGNGNSNIKQVNSIEYAGYPYAGITTLGARTTVLSEIANEVTVIHEFGHSCGLEHRDATNGVGQLLNPGNGGNAVMDPTNELSNIKINRYERDVINTATQ